MNILLIAGGWSVEREVSLSGGEQIHKALESLGHTVTRLDPSYSLHDLPEQASRSDFAFIILHGSPGEDGLIQAILEGVGCPYQGAGPAASMLALDKAAAKSLFRKAGLPTADWVLLPEKPAPGWQPDLPYPLFIKENNGGSSLNIEKVSRKEDLDAALDRLFSLSKSYIVEPAVDGMELTCGVLGRLEEGSDEEIVEALPPILIRPTAKSGVFDYNSKYAPGGAEELCPAPISEALTRRIQELSLAAHKVLGVSGYSRADFIGLEGEEPTLLEVNTLPGMTPTSLIPREGRAVGLSFEALIQRLIDLGLARHRRQKGGPRA